MSDPFVSHAEDTLEPVHTDDSKLDEFRWTGRFVLFLRVMAGLAMMKGLYHWARVCGIGIAPDAVFETHTMPWQSATVFFAVIDLVSAVGLWLAAPWGAVVWLTAVVSMVAVELLFPSVYGFGVFVTLAGGVVLALYLWLALNSAREQPP